MEENKRQELIENVPFIVYEAAMMRKERQMRRLWALVYVLSVAVVALAVAVIR